MWTTEYSEIYISIDTHTVAERVYKGEEKVGKESKVVERQRESVCVCECWSKPMIVSISIHKQRGIKKHIWQLLIAGIFDQLASFGEIWLRWSFSQLICYLGSDIWIYDNSRKGVPFSHTWS
jgi:hypothetical protein